MNYIQIGLSVAAIILFYKVGELDEELNSVVSLGVGVAVVALSYVLPWRGYVGFFAYVFFGIGVLTAYKFWLEKNHTKNL